MNDRRVESDQAFRMLESDLVSRLEVTQYGA